jgi:hypothetical protein
VRIGRRRGPGSRWLRRRQRSDRRSGGDRRRRDCWNPHRSGAEALVNAWREWRGIRHLATPMVLARLLHCDRSRAGEGEYRQPGQGLRGSGSESAAKRACGRGQPAAERSRSPRRRGKRRRSSSPGGAGAAATGRVRHPRADQLCDCEVLERDQRPDGGHDAQRVPRPPLESLVSGALRTHVEVAAHECPGAVLCQYRCPVLAVQRSSDLCAWELARLDTRGQRPTRPEQQRSDAGAGSA